MIDSTPTVPPPVDEPRRRPRGPRMRPASTADSALKAIRADIVGFVFRPGERLVELELSARYGISRTPIRDALRRLEVEGLVVARARGGRFVRAVDIAAYEHVYAVRKELETFAAGQAAERRDPGALDELRDGWRAEHAAQTVALDGSYLAADERFHLALARGSGNGYLIEVLGRVNAQLRVVRAVDFTHRERILRSERQHLEIAAAVAAGDGPTAMRLVADHIAESEREIRAVAVRMLTRAHASPTRSSR